ncbi:MAG TPA: thioesterase family protein [Polyangiaceae bacterium]
MSATAAPYVHRHRVGFDEVDAAGIVYFARFFTWCHDAMEAMLAPLAGGYTELVMSRRLGLPAVHVEADYGAPLRFGDEVLVEASVERLGTSSVALRFEIVRSPGREPVALVKHVVALVSLAAIRSQPLPDDVRAVFERYLRSGG